MWMFTTALFKGGKKSKCVLFDEWINKIWLIHIKNIMPSASGSRL
jgi:hypothetical protein